MSTENASSAWPRGSVPLLLVLLFGALLLKLAYHAEFREREVLASAPFGDSVVYLDEVARLFRGDGEPARHTAFYKPPLYSVLLHLLDAPDPARHGVVRGLQLAMGLGLLAGAFLLAVRLAGRTAGVVAFVLLALYAPPTFQETKLLDTTLGLSVSMTALLVLEATHRTRTGAGARFACGVLFGVAALARPANLPIALAFAPFVARGRLAHAAVFLTGFGLALAPVTLFNHRGSGDVIPVNYSEGHSFLVGNNPNARGMYNLPPGYPDGVLNERVVERQVAATELGREPSPNEQRLLSARHGLDYLLANPGEIPRLLGDKLRFAFTSYEVDDNYSLRREVEELGLLRVHVVPFALLLALGLPAFLLGSWRRLWILGVPLLMTLVTLLVFYTNTRYRLPAAPLLAVAAGVTVSEFRRAARMRQALALTLGAALFALSTWMPLPYPRAELDRSSRQFDAILDLHAAGTLLGRGQTDAAAQVLAKRLRTATPDSFEVAWIREVLASRSASERAALREALRTAAGDDVPLTLLEPPVPPR